MIYQQCYIELFSYEALKMIFNTLFPPLKRKPVVYHDKRAFQNRIRCLLFEDTFPVSLWNKFCISNANLIDIDSSLDEWTSNKNRKKQQIDKFPET